MRIVRPESVPELRPGLRPNLRPELEPKPPKPDLRPVWLGLTAGVIVGASFVLLGVLPGGRMPGIREAFASLVVALAVGVLVGLAERRYRLAHAVALAHLRGPQDDALQTSSLRLGSALSALMVSSERQRANIDQQSISIQETQVTAQEIRQMSTSASETAAAVLEIASRGEELGQSGEDAISRSLNGFTEIRDQVQAVGVHVNRLGTQTQQIESIAKTVKSLADQSGLLALNAAV